MTILVTGGAGFIGSHLAAALHADGAAVRALDDLSTGAAENLPPEVHLEQGDVRVRAHVEAALEGVTGVYHLAAAVGPALVARDPRGTWSRNARGTRTVLRACARRGIPVLLASSSEVYHPLAAARGAPLAEDARTGVSRGDRRGIYARSKLAGETAGRRYARRGLAVTCARFFNVVGPRQSARHGMVLARFAEAARGGGPLPIYGNGKQRRCFIHVADAVRAIRLLAGHPDAIGRAVNVGSDEEVSVRELARRVALRSGHRGTVRHLAVETVYGPGFRDPYVRRPDISLLRHMTGWRPLKSLDDAIDDAIRPRGRPRRRRTSAAAR